MMIHDDKPNEINGAANEALWQVATAVQQACYTAALTAYENARTDGLCHEGAWEIALDAMRAVKIETLANPSTTP